MHALATTRIYLLLYTSTTTTTDATDSHASAQSGWILIEYQTRELSCSFILMQLTDSPVNSLPSTITKMEDRKRPASQSNDELAPPSKRQAVNGTGKAHADQDMPWKDDLEVRVTRPPFLFMVAKTLFHSRCPFRKGNQFDVCFGLRCAALYMIYVDGANARLAVHSRSQPAPIRSLVDFGALDQASHRDDRSLHHSHLWIAS